MEYSLDNSKQSWKFFLYFGKMQKNIHSNLKILVVSVNHPLSGLLF